MTRTEEIRERRELLAELERVKAERDAAVADIERMLTYDDGDNGWVCDYCKPERNCGVLDETCNPKWRGIQAATGAEERMEGE